MPLFGIAVTKNVTLYGQSRVIGSLLNVLVDHPELWQQLQEDRSLVETVIEEPLLISNPIFY